ncbi:hypothetical protein SF12_03410, partial [Streptomyces sp. MBRL 601]
MLETAVIWTQVPAEVWSHWPGWSWPASSQVFSSGTQNGWPSVATMVEVASPSSSGASWVASTGTELSGGGAVRVVGARSVEVRMVTVTRVLSPLPMMVAATGCGLVSPVFGSVARTLSPVLTSSMGFFEPSAIRTLVPGTKLLTSQLCACASSPTASLACSRASSLTLLVLRWVGLDFWEGFDFGFGWDLGLALALGALLARALRAAARAAWARLA